ncbi:thialysine N-epsilon-acetyltransferase-like isoform X1 [Eretmochelys imbricata]
MECVVRPCRAEDCVEVVRMIKELAEFEKLPDQVQINDRVLREDGFANDPFYRCLVAEVPPEHRSRDGHTVVGYGLYFFTYSTWKGRNIYMEDLYVMPEFRDWCGEQMHPDEVCGAGLESSGHRLLPGPGGGGPHGRGGLALLPLRRRRPGAAGAGAAGRVTWPPAPTPLPEPGREPRSPGSQPPLL